MTTTRESLLAHPLVVAADAFANARHGAINHRRKWLDKLIADCEEAAHN